MHMVAMARCAFLSLSSRAAVVTAPGRRRGTRGEAAGYRCPLRGGILGASSYLLLNVNETLEFGANGGRKMPRKWSKAILHDFLCRQLPAIRVEDAIPCVVADSSVCFRRQAKCTQCHATIDRLASTLRGFRSLSLFGEEEDQSSGYFAAFWPFSQPEQPGWPALEDPEYDEQPPLGTLYYRRTRRPILARPRRWASRRARRPSEPGRSPDHDPGPG